MFSPLSPLGKRGSYYRFNLFHYQKGIDMSQEKIKKVVWSN